MRNIFQDIVKAIRDWSNSKFQPKGNYLTEVPDEYATSNYVHTEISKHNTSNVSHDDIRELLAGLATRLNAVADSDDITLDQLSEIVAYIKANRDLIDSVTTSKVSVSDIVDNLTSTAADKPLSANQGNSLRILLNEGISYIEARKVSKVTNKGLSTNDYTDEEKTRNAANATAIENMQTDLSPILPGQLSDIVTCTSAGNAYHPGARPIQYYAKNGICYVFGSVMTSEYADGNNRVQVVANILPKPIARVSVPTTTYLDKKSFNIIVDEDRILYASEGASGYNGSFFVAYPYLSE